MENLIKELKENHLHNNIDLTSFKPKEIEFLEIAFEAGARCMYNKLTQCVLADSNQDSSASNIQAVSCRALWRIVPCYNGTSTAVTEYKVIDEKGFTGYIGNKYSCERFLHGN